MGVERSANLPKVTASKWRNKNLNPTGLVRGLRSWLLVLEKHTTRPQVPRSGQDTRWGQSGGRWEGGAGAQGGGVVLGSESTSTQDGEW